MASNREENTSSNNRSSEFAVPKPVVSNDVMKGEEEKLKAKYQLPSNWCGSGHSAFLQKKLAKGQKFFDSGDYQMAKQNTGVANAKVDRAAPQPLFTLGTGETIPTPDTVPARKTSIIQPKYTSAT